MKAPVRIRTRPGSGLLEVQTRDPQGRWHAATPGLAHTTTEAAMKERERVMRRLVESRQEVANG